MSFKKYIYFLRYEIDYDSDKNNVFNNQTNFLL